MRDVKYISKPFVLLSTDGIVLSAGTLDEITTLHERPYYAHCEVQIREHDLHLNDNTLVPNLEFPT